MASHHLSSSFLLLLLSFALLLLSPQTQAREGKFFNFFSHFTTTSHHKLKSHPPSPSPSPSPSSSGSIAATPESILASPAPAPAPESSSESSSPVPSPAESEFADRGDGYGLYGTTSFQSNNNDNHESFNTGFGTKLYSNYNEEQYRNSYNNNNNHQEYYNNNDRYSYNNNNNFYESNNGYNGGYERKREGMSDTRFVENGKYFFDVKGENDDQNDHYYYKVDGYEPTGRGNNVNNNYGGSYYEENSYNNNNNYKKYPNEFDTMEEYEKQQENQGYRP